MTKRFPNERQVLVGPSNRRQFLGTTASIMASALLPTSSVKAQTSEQSTQAKGTTFEWQLPTKDRLEEWQRYSFNVDRWWGDFSRSLPDEMDMFGQNPWA